MKSLCGNRKLWIAITIGAVAIAIVTGNALAALPFLLLLACPLAMLVMMGGMFGMGRGKRNGDDRVTESPVLDDEAMRLRAEVAELRERVGR